MGRTAGPCGARGERYGTGVRHRPAQAEVDFPVYPTVAAVESWTADVLVDFTQPSVVADNLREALPASRLRGGHYRPVERDVAGWPRSRPTAPVRSRAELRRRRVPDGVRQGRRAVLPEVIEFHHCNKKDARVPRCARRRSSLKRGGRASEAPGKTEIGVEGAARSWTACRCIPCARWATSPARK